MKRSEVLLVNILEFWIRKRVIFKLARRSFQSFETSTAPRTSHTDVTNYITGTTIVQKSKRTVKNSEVNNCEGLLFLASKHQSWNTL